MIQPWLSTNLKPLSRDAQVATDIKSLIIVKPKRTVGIFLKFNFFIFFCLLTLFNHVVTKMFYMAGQRCFDLKDCLQSIIIGY